MGILHHGLSVQSVGVALVAITVQLLFYGQTIACLQGQGAAGFGSSSSMTTYYITAGINIEAAVVDGIGNVAGSGQFVGICRNRGNYFAGRVAVVTIAYFQRSSGYGSFQLIFSCTASAGNVSRIPSFVGQSGYSTGIAVNLNRFATGGRAYGDAVCQLKANLVVAYGGDDVVIAFVSYGLGQFNGISCAVVGSNLEAVFFQVVQLAAVDGFFAACANSAVRYVTQGNRTTCRIAYQIHLVARCIGGVTCIVNVSHRGIEFNFGYAVGGVDFGYSTLTINKVDGIAVGHEVFSYAVTLYGEAGVQYVINGSGIVAFVVGSQCSTIVVGRIGGGGSSDTSQVALHIGQSSRGGGVTGCILHAGNHIAGGYLSTCTVGLGVELAVGVFIHFAPIGLGVYHRGLGVLHHGLSIQSVGVGLITIGAIHFLFHSQTVTCGKGDFLAGFNGSGGGSSTASQPAAGCGLEAAVVDGIGNIAGSSQFVGICRNRGNYFAGRVAVVTIAYFQRSSGYGLSSNLICHSLQLSNVHCIRICRTCGHINDLAGTILRTY